MRFFFEAHKTEMPMLNTVAEKIFRIIATVEDDDTVVINIERLSEKAWRIMNAQIQGGRSMIIIG